MGLGGLYSDGWRRIRQRVASSSGGGESQADSGRGRVLVHGQPGADRTALDDRHRAVGDQGTRARLRAVPGAGPGQQRARVSPRLLALAVPGGGRRPVRAVRTLPARRGPDPARQDDALARRGGQLRDALGAQSLVQRPDPGPVPTGRGEARGRAGGDHRGPGLGRSRGLVPGSDRAAGVRRPEAAAARLRVPAVGGPASAAGVLARWRLPLVHDLDQVVRGGGRGGARAQGRPPPVAGRASARLRRGDGAGAVGRPAREAVPRQPGGLRAGRGAAAGRHPGRDRVRGRRRRPAEPAGRGDGDERGAGGEAGPAGGPARPAGPQAG